MKLMAETVTVTGDWLTCGNVELVGGKPRFPRPVSLCETSSLGATLHETRYA
jgi:hypothetical protein